jgi:hypothetical protein
MDAPGYLGEKVRFDETPKPAREARTLPNERNP